MGKYSKFVITVLYLGVVIFMVAITSLVVYGVKKYVIEPVDYNYALDDVFNNDIIPVMKTQSELIIRPYISDSVKVGKYFYDYEDNTEKQKDSIIFYENTYLQNTGVDYVSDDVFEIVSVLDGEVIGIEEDSIYGSVITIKNNDNLITSYSNLQEILVNVGYKVSQGEIIAKSTVSKVDNSVKSLLHFEVLYKGNYIDPENLYTLKVSELQ